MRARIATAIAVASALALVHCSAITSFDGFVGPEPDGAFPVFDVPDAKLEAAPAEGDAATDSGSDASGPVPDASTAD